MTKPRPTATRRARARSSESVSLRHVADAAGVSTATVSRCINNIGGLSEETRQRVLEAIRRLAYTPNLLARDFRRGRTNMLLIVLPSIGDPFFTEIMRGVHEEARKQGYGILIKDTQLNTLSANEVETVLISRQADGIILMGTASPFGTLALGARGKRAIPIVIGCEGVIPELDRYSSVRIDNVRAAEEATRHLIDLGHRRIAFISGIAGSVLAVDRERGYRKAVAAAHGMAGPIIEEGGLTVEGGERAARRLFARRPRPTAIFCANDEMAIGAAYAITSSGHRIPEDISLVGFDDTRHAAVMSPPLTTVMQPAHEIGVRSVRSICRAIERQGDPAIEARHEIVPHRLVVRQSSGPAPRLPVEKVK